MNPAIDHIVTLDQELFLWLNGMHRPWADTLMYWITFKFTWIPLYVLLIFFTIKAEGKKAIFAILTVIVAVAIADLIASGLMKPFFQRPRPCHDPLLQGFVHMVGNCGGPYGFVSSHASTSFALATVWYLLLCKRFRWIWLLPVWAALYAYSRIYVGVHYPADIIIGGMLGILCGLVMYTLYIKNINKYYRN